MQLPEPKGLSYKSLLNAIDQGVIKIPQFQRDYVWTKEGAANLIDSIVKGYPIGTLIMWKTQERLRVIRNLGDVDLPDVPKGHFANYVLDGQQRLTSLYCALNGIKLERKNKIEDFSQIFIDLTATDSEQVVITDVSHRPKSEYVSLTKLLTATPIELVTYGTEVGFSNEDFATISEYSSRIIGYNFSVIEVNDAPLEVATEIFTRINVEGKALSLFEIMVAKTFDAEHEFDLSEQFERLQTRLIDVDYGTIPAIAVLQTLALITGTECSRKRILQIDKQIFIEEWPKVASAVEAAVDYFRDYYKIPVGALLPYYTLIVPFAYFFYHHPNRPFDGKQHLLEDFFWRASISERYSSSVEGKLGQDVKRIDLILEDKSATYDWELITSSFGIEERGYFNAGRSFIKAMLCLLASHNPRSFADGATVRISSDWLKRANSKNYHHFFPKSFVRKITGGVDEGNHIANITIVDDFLNKREIGAKAPSKYMQKFKDNNPELEAHMATHLVQLEDWGIWEDDYEVFKKRRCEALFNELKSRLQLTEREKAIFDLPPLTLEDLGIEVG